jgi:hypothetical protein
MLVSIIMLALATIGATGIIGAACGADHMARTVSLNVAHPSATDTRKAYADIMHALTYHN